MKRLRYITPSKEKKEIRETKEVLINGHVLTLVRVNEKNRPVPSFMGMKGWALQVIIKMKRQYKPIPKMRRTK